VKDGHVKDEHAKDATQDVAGDVAEGVLGAAIFQRGTHA